MDTFTYWASIEGPALLWLVLIIYGTALWERYRGKPVHNAYLVGIGFLLVTLALDTILLMRRKSIGILRPWSLQNPDVVSWFMPILWYAFAILACISLAILYLGALAKTFVEDTKAQSDLNMVRKHNIRLSLMKLVFIWSLVGIIALFYTNEFMYEFLDVIKPSDLRDIFYLWGFIGVLLLLLILIVKGIARWQKGKNRPVSYSYLVGVVYLVLTISPVCQLIKIRDSLAAAGMLGPSLSKKALSIHLFFIPLYWTIFVVMMCSYLGWLFLKAYLQEKGEWEEFRQSFFQLLQKPEENTD